MSEIDPLKEAVNRILASNDLAREAAANLQANTVLAQSEPLSDISKLNLTDFANKYGIDAAQNRGRVQEQADILAAQRGSFRDKKTIAADAARNISASGLNAVGSVIGLGGKLVDEAIGDVRNITLGQYLENEDGSLVEDREGNLIEKPNPTNISGAINKFSGTLRDGIKNYNSPEIKAQQAAANATRLARKQANATLYAADKADNETFIDNLHDMGKAVLRDAGSEFETLKENPGVAGGVVEDGIGSLAGSAGILGKLGKATNGSKAAIALGVGSVESAGTFQATYDHIDKMSFEQLAKNSPRFQAMVDAGLSKKAARTSIAQQAAGKAAAVQLPISSVLGLGVAKFEAAPLLSTGLTNTLTNIASQTFEETLQGVIGQLNQNAAVKDGADVTQDIVDDVGSSAVQGAIGALGASGALQTPVVVGRTTKKTLGVIGKATKAAYSKASAATRARIEASSPVSDDKTQARIVEVDDQIEAAKQALATGELVGQAFDESLPEFRALTEQEAHEENIRDAYAQRAVDANNQLSPEEQEAQLLVPPRLPADDPNFVLDAQTQANEQAEEDLRIAQDQHFFNHNQLSPEEQEAQLLVPPRLPSDTEPTLTVENDPDVPVFAQNLDRAQNITSNDFGDIPDSLGVNIEEGAEQVSRFQLTQIAIDKIDQLEEGSSEYNDTVLFAVAQISQMGDLVASDIPSSITALDDNSEIKQQVLQARDTVTQIISNPKFRAAAEKVFSVTQDQTNTPEVNEANVKQAVELSRYNPIGVNSDFIDVILDQKNIKKFNFTPDTVASLKLAGEIARRVNSDTAAKEAIEAERVRNSANPVPPRKTRDIVSQEIYLDGKTSTDKNGAKIVLPSLNDYYNTIIRASRTPNGITTDRTGQPVHIENTFAELSDFAQHMVNKVEALKTSIEEGRGRQVSYDTLTPTGFVPAGTKGSSVVFGNMKSPNSIATAKEILVDAKSVVDMHNLLLQELNLAGSALTVPTISQLSGEKTDANSDNRTDSNVSDKASNPEVPAPKKPDTTEVTDNRASKTDSNPAEVESTVRGVGDSPSGNRSEALSDDKTDTKEFETVSEKVVGDDNDGSTADSRPAPRDFLGLKASANGVVRFDESYTPGEGNALTSTENPHAELIKLLSDVSALPYTVTDNSLKIVQDIIKSDVPKLVKSINARLNTIKINSKQTVAQAIEAGVDVAGLRDGRAASVLENNEIKYNEQLAQLAVIAAMDWVINLTASPVTKEEDARKAFGLRNVTEVTPDMLIALSSGPSTIAAKESLATKIEQYWDVKKNKNSSISHTRGISEGIAAEILAAMEGKYIERKPFKVNKVLNGKLTEIDYMAVSLPQRLKGIFAKLGSGKKVLNDLVLKEPAVESVSIGVPHTKVPETQRHNHFSKLTDVQKKVIAAKQKDVYKPNIPMLDVMQFLGKELYTTILGAQTLDPEKMNAIDLKSAEGKNLNLSDAWDKTMSQFQEVQEYAEKNGIEVAETELYYNWYVTRVGRLHQAGFGPQSDKTARVAFTTTEATLDLNNDEHDDAFWLTVAQASGLVDPEKGTNQDGIQEAKKQYYNRFSVVQDIISERINNPEYILTKEDRAIIERELTGVSQVSASALNTIVHVIRYENAIAAGGEAAANFKSSLPLEADGVSDGPITAIVNMTSGEFTPDQLKIMEKGGLKFGENNWTLDKNYKDPNYRDLYNTGADNLKTRMANLSLQLKRENKGAHDNLIALLNFMNHFGEITFKDGDLIIGRNSLKNPLTVTIYGSSVKGVTGKVASGLMKAFYAEVTELIQSGNFKDYPSLSADLQTLFSTRALINKKGKWVKFWSKNAAPTLENLSKEELINFEFTAEQKSNFLINVQNLFAQPMTEVIDDLIGSVKDNMKIFQKATEIQSIIMADKFDSAVLELLEQKYESGELSGKIKLRKDGTKYAAGEFLTQKDLDKIYKDLEKFGAIIENDNQVFNIGVAQKSESNYDLSRTYDGHYAGRSTLPAPANAGVKAAAYLNIGTGDGRMIDNYISDNPSSKNTLPVFDGIELNALHAVEESRKINKAVSKGWSENPPADVANSFQSFLRENPLENLSEKGRDALSRLLTKEETLLTDGEIMGYFSLLSDNLGKIADETAARTKAMNSINHSIDHMASASAPYNHLAKTVPNDPTEIVKELNRVYRETLNQKKPEVIEKQNEVLAKEIKLVGRTRNGVTVVGSNVLREVLSNTKMSDELKSVFEAVKGAIPENIEVVIGKLANVSAWRDEKYPARAARASLENGQYDPYTNTIYVTNVASETLVHELMHATTFQKVFDFYVNNSLLSEQDKGAIKRLEALMNDFIQRDFDSFDNDTLRNAANTAQSEIKSYLDQDTDVSKASALNEFMAWTLTNDNLIQANKQTINRNPLSQITGKVKILMRRLLGAIKKDVFSNVLFNTKLLLETPINKLDGASPNVILNQVQSAGQNQRIAGIMALYDAKLASFLRKRGVEGELSKRGGEALTEKTSNHFIAEGFNMDMQQKQAFRAIQIAYATEMDLSPVALTEASKVHAHVIKNLSVGDFYPVGVTEPTDNEHRLAQSKFSAITGGSGTTIDASGRTSLLSGFMALSQTDEQFRRILNEMPPMETIKLKGDTLDQTLTNLGNKFINSLATHVHKNEPNIQRRLDQLTYEVGKIEQDSQTFIEQASMALLSRGDAQGSKLINKLGLAIHEASSTKLDEAETVLKQRLYQAGSLIGRAISLDKAGEVRQAITSTTNVKGFSTTLRDFVGELFTQNDDNKIVLELVNKVKFAVSRVRQQFKESLPNIIQAEFSKKLTKEQWSALYTGLGKTDIGAIMNYFTPQHAVDVLADTKTLDDSIESIEAQLPKAHRDLYIKKAKQLGRFQITGLTPGNLLRNAYAIAALLGEDVNVDKSTLDETLISKLDALASLYSIKHIDPVEQRRLSELIDKERKGVQFAAYYLQSLKSMEDAKLTTDMARFNHYKVGIPSTPQDGVRLVIADNSEFSNLVNHGYKDVGKYEGPHHVLFGKSMSYYFSSVSGKARYTQGAMQTVQTAVGGTDPRTGRTLSGVTAGFISGKAAASLTKRLKVLEQLQLKQGKTLNELEPLLPVYGSNGKVVAYEPRLSPEHLKKLNLSTHLGEAMGTWAGRQAEETIAKDFNKLLVDRLFIVWRKGIVDGRQDEYQDMFTSDDPVHKDTMKVIPKDMRDYIEQKFGPDGFMVRRDMINAALGYREASVKDLFNAEGRLPKTVRETLKESAITIFGGKAYNFLAKTENIVQTTVSTAKNLIVIRSGVVPVANLLSNQVQQLNRGIPTRYLMKTQREVLVEIDSHLRNSIRRNEIEAKLLATTHLNTRLRLKNELASLGDAAKRMSIAPLIDAGEFSTIQEGLTQMDNDLMEQLTKGNFMGWVESVVEKAPDGFKTAGKYAVVSPNTALYQGVSRAVQYGDFLAKATYYRYMVEEQGISHEQALGKVTSEFVNYNLPEGRVRSYAESIGLTWFWNFKIRSVKTSVSLIKENPLRSLLSVYAVDNSPVDIGSPITDNFGSVLADGRLHYSIGPEMVFNSPDLNPWLNIIN